MRKRAKEEREETEVRMRTERFSRDEKKMIKR